MALKKRIDKDEFAKLSKDLQANYTASGDNYILDLEADDAAELRRAKDASNRERDEAKRKVSELEAKIAELSGTTGDPPADKDKDKNAGTSDAVKALEAKLTKQLAALETASNKKLADAEAKLASRDAITKKTMIQATADKIAQEISTVPTIMSRHIADNLDVEFGDDGTAKLVVIGSDGKPSGATLEQLTKQVRGNKEFAGIIIANKASGSGAPDNSRKTSGTGTRDASSNNPDGSGKSDGPNPYRLKGKELGNWASNLVAERTGRNKDG